MSFIALDPSTTNTGLAFFNSDLDFAINIEPSRDHWVDRCSEICDILRQYIRSEEPDVIVSEHVHVGPNRGTAMKLSELHGMIRREASPIPFKRANVKEVRKELGIYEPPSDLKGALYSLASWIDTGDPDLLYDVHYFLHGVGDKTMQKHIEGDEKVEQIDSFLSKFRVKDITPKELVDKLEIDEKSVDRIAARSDDLNEFIINLEGRDEKAVFDEHYKDKWNGKQYRDGRPKISEKKVPVFNYVYEETGYTGKADDNLADAIVNGIAYRECSEIFE